MATGTGINALMVDPGPNIYYSDGFRQVLEDHLSWLRTHPSTRLIQVSAQAAWQHDQDLCGFLQTLHLPMQYHWVTMRMNNFTSPTQFGAHTSLLLMPAPTVLEQLRSAYLTSSVMNP